MTQQVSYGHFLSCCLKIHFRRSKERGQLARGHNSFPLESQWPDEKDILQTKKMLSIKKLHHSACLICSVQIISTRIDGVYEVPLSTRNFDVDISVTSISPLEWVVYKCSNSRLKQIV